MCYAKPPNSRLSRAARAVFAVVEVLNQHHFVVAFVVDHLVDHVAGDEDAEAAGSHTHLGAVSLVLHRVVVGVENRRVVEGLDGESFAGVFDAVEDDAR